MNLLQNKQAEISIKSISNWLKKENEIKSTENLFNTALHPGIKPKYEEIEEKLFEFVSFNKTLGNPITTLVFSLRIYQIK